VLLTTGVVGGVVLRDVVCGRLVFAGTIGWTINKGGFTSLKTLESQLDEAKNLFLPALSSPIDASDFFCSTPEAANNGINPIGCTVGRTPDRVGNAYTGSMSKGIIASAEAEYIVKFPTLNVLFSPTSGVKPYTPFFVINRANPVTFRAASFAPARITGVYTYGITVPGM
jgi:hypothetical protein